jgi:CHAT domain-containing protein
VFEQCISRANDTESNKDLKSQSILAVYESPNGYGWENQREEIYEMCYEIAEELADATIFTGSEVDKELFRSQCGASDIIHFFGHAANDANTQYIEICASRKTKPDVQSEPALKAEPLDLLVEDMSEAKIEKPDSADSQPEIDQLTISDIFTTRITSSHFNLIACGSSSQIVKPGDEPWGIVTALLCAGATSVGGTLWPIQVSTGQEFMRKLFGPAQHTKGGNDADCVDLAIKLQETIKKMKKDADFREPYDWAGFVLNGSWFYC